MRMVIRHCTWSCCRWKTAEKRRRRWRSCLTCFSVFNQRTLKRLRPSTRQAMHSLLVADALLSPVHTSNSVEVTLSKQQATLLPVASTLLPFWATMSKHRSTLSKGRNFNAKPVRHCCRFWQQSRMLLRNCSRCGPGFSDELAWICSWT